MQLSFVQRVNFETTIIIFYDDIISNDMINYYIDDIILF